jgi:hypothetical protein
MGIERDDGKIQSGVKPPQSKKEGSAISREDAKGRKVLDRELMENSFFFSWLLCGSCEISDSKALRQHEESAGGGIYVGPPQNP